MKKFVRNLVVLLTTVVCTSSFVLNGAEVHTTGGGGNWNSGATWEGGSVPSSTDDIVVDAGDNLTINVDATCASLKFYYDDTYPTFTVDGSQTLTVNGILTIQDSIGSDDGFTANIDGIINTNSFRFFGDTDGGGLEFNIGDSGELNILAVSGLSYFRFNLDESSPDFTLTSDGNISSAHNFQFQVKSRANITINIRDKFTLTKKLQLEVPSTSDIPGSINLILTDTLEIGGDLSLKTSGTGSPTAANNKIDMLSTNAVLILGGDISYVTNGGTIDAPTASGLNTTFELNGTSTQTISTQSTIEYYDLKINNSTGVNLSTDLTSNFNGDLIINSGAILNASANIDFNGDFINAGTFNSTGSDINIGGNWNNTGDYSFTQGDNVIFDGTGAQTISGTDTFYSVNIANLSSGVSIISGMTYILGILDLDDGTLATNDSITLISINGESGCLDNIFASQSGLSGDLIVEGYFNLGVTQEWMTLTSPIQNTALSNFQDDGLTMTGFTGSDKPNLGFVSVYSYNETLANSNAGNGWVEATNITNTITPSSANIIYAASGEYKLSVKGTPYQDKQEINLSYEDDAGDISQEGWNLIGNPYPCTIDINNLDVGDFTNVDQTIYIHDPTVGSYALFTIGDELGEHGTSRYIPAFQGFFMHANGSGAKIIINEDDKAPTEKDGEVNTRPLFNNKIHKLYVQMETDSNRYKDRATIRIDDNAKMGYDPKDGLKLKGDAKAPYLAFVADYDFGVNSIPSSFNNLEIPLKALQGEGFKGSYKLSFNNQANFFPESCISLVDMHKGITKNIRDISEYAFESSDTTTMARFKIVITKIFTSSTENATCFDSSTGKVMLACTPNQEITDIIWKDGSGNIIKTVTDTVVADSLLDLKAGTYSYSAKAISCDLTLTDTVTITQPNKISADFNLEKNPIYLSKKDKAVFNNLSTPNLSYKWEFGNGDSSVEESPNYKYKIPGVYTVKLIVNLNDHCLEYVEKTLEVKGLAPDDEECYISQIKNASCFDSNDGYLIIKSRRQRFDEIVYLNATGTDTLEIQDDPGAVDTLENLKAGTYIVHSKVCNTPLVDTLVIEQPEQITASFNIVKDTIPVNMQVEVVNNSINGFKYNWDFGDGFISNLFEPIHVYSDTGLFTIELEVFDQDSICSVTDSNLVFVGTTTSILNSNSFSEDDINIYKSGSDYFVNFNVKSNSSAVITVLNTLGQTLMESVEVDNINDFTFKLNIDASKTEIYFLRVQMENNTIF